MRRSMQFELRHAFYAMALVGASLALMGGTGIIAASGILCVWALIFREKRQIRVTEVLVLLAVAGICTALQLPAEPNWLRGWSRGRFQVIGDAIRQYELQHDALPPASICDSSGKPIHSWRVLILPQLGHQELYDEYHFDEPWDGPQNRRLLEKMPREYFHPLGTTAPGMTSFVAVVGPNTLWSFPAEGLFHSPGLRKHVMVVNAEFHPVPWTKPDDLPIDDVNRLFELPNSMDVGVWRRGFFASDFYGREAIAPDRAMTWVRSDLPASTISSVFNLDDEATIALRTAAYQPKRVLHFGNFFRLAIFLGLAFWPAIWARRQSASPEETAMAAEHPSS